MSKIDRPEYYLELEDTPKYNTPKYKLIREDGLTKKGHMARWIEWNEEDNSFKELHDKPSIGRSFILDPNRLSFTWCTTKVAEILEEGENYIKFKTQNSIYTLYNDPGKQE